MRDEDPGEEELDRPFHRSDSKVVASKQGSVAGGVEQAEEEEGGRNRVEWVRKAFARERQVERKEEEGSCCG
jgi:hypothetical protein